MLSKTGNIIASKLRRYGSTYTSNGADFKAIISKANVSYDRPTREFTLLSGYNADISDGCPIAGQDDHYIPTKLDRPNRVGGNVQYIRGYLRQANASIDVKTYVDPENASKDVWGSPTGSVGINWGWVTKKTAVWVSFERMEMKPDFRNIGQIENAEYLVILPWNMNASFTPIPECRFSDRYGKNWRVLDIDDKTYNGQAYVARIGTDAR